MFKLTRVFVPIAVAGLLLTGCGSGESDDTVVTNQKQDEASASDEEKAPKALPDVPQSHSSLAVIGDKAALPVGTGGEVTVVAISEPGDMGTAFPFILHNGTDQPVSRIQRARGGS